MLRPLHLEARHRLAGWLAGKMAGWLVRWVENIFKKLLHSLLNCIPLHQLENQQIISNPLVNEAHATSLRGKYTRAGLFLCNVYTLVGYAKPLLARPTIPMAGPTNSIPQTSH